MSQRAVVTVRADKIGIVAGITKILAELKINIDISQTLL